MPLIFSGSESDAVDRANERTVRTSERNLHRVCVVLVFVNDHDGPLSIRALDGVGRDQHVAGCVAYVAGCAKKPALRHGREPTVSPPVSWDEVAACRSPEELVFAPDAVLNRIEVDGDLLADLV